MTQNEWVEEFLVGEAYSNIAISLDNQTILATTGNFCEILTEKDASIKNQKRRLIKHETKVVGVFFEGDSKFWTVTENGKISEYDISKETVDSPNKLSERIVTAFPVVFAISQRVGDDENSRLELWLILQKQNNLELCVVCANSSIEMVLQIPKEICKNRISIEGNLICYALDHEVKTILLNSDRKIMNEWNYTWTDASETKDEQLYRFIRLAQNGNHLAVTMANGIIYQWSNIRTNGVSDTYQTSHWHKVAPQLAVTQFGNILSAGAECALARHTKGQKNPTMLPRLVAPVTGLYLSQDSSVVVLQLEDNSIHTVLLSTMAIKKSIPTLQFCPRSVNVILTDDPLWRNLFVMNGKPGFIQWVNPETGKTTNTAHITLENAVDGDMSLVGIRPGYRDVISVGFGLNYFATIEKFVDFKGDNIIRFWKRIKQNITMVTSVEANPDVVFIGAPTSRDSILEKTFVTASTSGTISVWEYSNDAQNVKEDLTRRRNWQEMKIDSVSKIMDDGRFVTVHDKHVVLWNVKDMKVIDLLSCCSEVISAQIVQPNILIHTKTEVLCWNATTLSVPWRIKQNVDGIEAGLLGSIAFQGNQAMVFDVSSGHVKKSIKFSAKIERMCAYQTNKGCSYVAKTENGVMAFTNKSGPSEIESKKLSPMTPFHEMGEKVVSDLVNGDQKFVKTPKPDPAQFFAGPVHSLPPIQFIAPLFIQKALLPRCY